MEQGRPRIKSSFGLPVLGHGKVDSHLPHGDRLLGLGKEASSPSRRAISFEPPWTGPQKLFESGKQGVFPLPLGEDSTQPHS